jgi:hypothetical protein
LHHHIGNLARVALGKNLSRQSRNVLMPAK